MDNSEKRIEAAVANKSRMNCALSVTVAFHDVMGVDEATAMRMGNAFGLGMGNMDGTCGALTGAALVVSMTSADKIEATRTMAEIMRAFKAKNGTTRCCELKGLATRKPILPCPECVRDAATFLADVLP